MAAGFVYAPELLPREKRTRQQVEGLGWACAGVIAAFVVAAIAIRFGTFPGADVYTLR